MSANGASLKCHPPRRTAAYGSKGDPGKPSNGVVYQFTPLILCGQLHRPNVFQDSPKIRLWRKAHGSISVQEGQPGSRPQIAALRRSRAPAPRLPRLS